MSTDTDINPKNLHQAREIIMRLKASAKATATAPTSNASGTITAPPTKPIGTKSLRDLVTAAGKANYPTDASARAALEGIVTAASNVTPTELSTRGTRGLCAFVERVVAVRTDRPFAAKSAVHAIAAYANSIR